MREYCKNYKKQAKNPFAVIPWNEDFIYKLQDLVDMFVQEQGFAMQDIVLVFPNARPKRYLTARYKERAGQKKKAGILPQIYTNTEFYTLCLHHFERGLPLFSEQEPLDRYAELFEIVKNILQKKKYSHFSACMEIQNEDEQKDNKEALQIAKFYPWAQSLDKLFEECFAELVLPHNIHYAEEVSSFAKSLLGDIEEIFESYVQSMQKNIQTTPAYSLYRTAQYVLAYEDYKDGKKPDPKMFFRAVMDDKTYFADFMPYLLQGKCIIFAGFVEPSKAEDVILKYFWENGACICLDTDSKLVTDRNALHYSCAAHKKWLQKWQAEAVLIGSGKETKPQLHFVPAYDFHSQLTVLKEDIRPYLETTQDRDDYCAVVLPNSSLLMPVLHELPTKKINISVGYPIQRTLLWQFIEHIFVMQLNKKKGEENVFQTADILALLQHPFTKMLLNPSSGDEKKTGQELCTKDNFTTWRKVLYYAEKFLGEKGVNVDFAAFVTDEIFNLDENGKYYELSSEKMEDFVEEFFRLTVFGWNKINTLHDIGSKLAELISFFIDFGESVWNRFPLDNEGIARFLQNTIPTLMQNGLAKNVFPPETLYSIVEQCMMTERVPFEADPLTSLQVLGMLETRLLSFENVFILDCVENVLPTLHTQDELMPDSLRSLFGLPDRRSHDMLMAHMFYRLIHSAKQVYCYWQEGVQSSEIQSSKSVRSRFIEELIWEEEKKSLTAEKNLNAFEKELLRPVSCNPLAPDRRKKRSIPLETFLPALELKAEKGFSTGELNTYLQCPARFYYQYLANISEPAKQEVGDNALLFGTKMHEFLKEQYAAKPVIVHDEVFKEQFMRNFRQKFNKTNWQDCLSADSYFMLQETEKNFFENYFANMPHEVTIAALEHKLSCLLSHKAFSAPILLKGVTDRIDKRGDSYWIIDYKTSQNKKKQTALWKNTPLLEELADMNASWRADKADECFEKLAMHMEDIQLPFYLYLFAKDSMFRTQHNIAENAHINAAWIFLSSREDEDFQVALIDEKYAGSEEAMWDMLYTVRENNMDVVLNFIFNHMVKQNEWKCKEGKYCGFCPFADYC